MMRLAAAILGLLAVALVVAAYAGLPLLQLCLLSRPSPLTASSPARCP